MRLDEIKQIKEDISGFNSWEVSTNVDELNIGGEYYQGKIIVIIDDNASGIDRQQDFAGQLSSPEEYDAMIKDIADDVNHITLDKPLIGVFADFGDLELSKRIRGDVVYNTMMAHMSPVGEDDDDTLWFKNLKG